MKNGTIIVRLGLAFGLLVALTTGCKREEVLPDNPKPTASVSSNDIGFDWENSIYIPTSPASTHLPVPVPWGPGVNSDIDIYTIGDYHKIDGWNMVYNTFTNVDLNNNNLPPLFFALYNRYRGILRYYLYIPGSQQPSTNLTNGLMLQSTGYSSSMLNFEGQDIVDPNVNISGFTKVNKLGIAATGGWHVMQYQIAYDKNYPTQTFSAFHPFWEAKNISITDIKLQGAVAGGIGGTITTPKPDADLASIFANGAIGAAELITGFAGPASVLTGYFGAAAAGGLSGNTTNFFSGIISALTASPTVQTVDLTINANITLTGTAVTPYPYLQQQVFLPAQPLSSPYTTVSDFIGKPITNEPVGLFNLTGRPQVIVTAPSATTRSPDYIYYYSYYIAGYGLNINTPLTTNNPTALVQFNPAIINASPTGATITNYKKEVVVFDYNSSIWQLTNGQYETVGTYNVATGAGGVSFSHSSIRPPASFPTGAAVRISFNVVPNNKTTPPIFIVKTFKADVSVQYY